MRIVKTINLIKEYFKTKKQSSPTIMNFNNLELFTDGLN